MGINISRNIKAHFSNLWNRFDAIIYTMLVVSIILRFSVSEENFVWARMLYALTLTLFYVRFMQAFFVEKNIGPKVIMIRRMVRCKPSKVLKNLYLENLSNMVIDMHIYSD